MYCIGVCKQIIFSRSSLCKLIPLIGERDIFWNPVFWRRRWLIIASYPPELAQQREELLNRAFVDRDIRAFEQISRILKGRPLIIIPRQDNLPAEPNLALLKRVGNTPIYLYTPQTF